MLKTLKYVITLTTLLWSFTAIAALENFTFDPNHSYVLWHINHFGFSNPSGKWPVEGTLQLDQEKPQNSKVDVKITLADIITGIPKLDEHLKGKTFFDVAKFPLATFVSNKVEVTGKHTAKVTGILTVHGVSHPVTLDVVLNKIGLNPITTRKTVGFTANTVLKRSDFEMNTLLPMIGDDVKIDIEAEAYVGPLYTP